MRIKKQSLNPDQESQTRVAFCDVELTIYKILNKLFICERK